MDSSTALDLDTWNHIAATLNGSTGTLYINGEVVGSNTSMHIPEEVMRDIAYIGRSNWSNDAYANADFDDIRIWNTALSQTDIQANMYNRLDGDKANLLAYYSFESGDATDMTGNNDGTLSGNVSTGMRGITVAASGSGDISGVLPMGAGDGAYVSTEPRLGSLTLNTDGSFTYSPTDSSASGTDSFSYYILSNGGGASYAETVTVTLEGLSIGGGTSGLQPFI